MTDNKVNKHIGKIIILAIIIVTFSFLYAKIDVKHSMYNSKVDNADWIVSTPCKDEKVIADFKIKEKAITGIEVQLDLDNKNEQGKVIANIVDKNNKILAKGTIDFSDIASGKFNDIYFNKKLKINENEKYTVVFTSESKNSVLRYSFIKENNKMHFSINGNKQDGELIFRTLTHRFDVETFIMSIVLLCFISGFLKLLFKLFKA